MTKTYRFSALASAFVRMWRGWRVLVPVVIVNAALQALLIWPAFTYEATWWTVTSAVISAAVMWVSFALLTATALQVADGPVHWSAARAAFHANLVRFAGWSLGWAIVTAIGLAFYAVPGVLVIAVTPFLALAVLDGQPRPLRANFAVIRRRAVRWLVTIAITLAIATLAWYVSGFAAFLLRGPLATSLVWLVGGWLVAWFVTAFALIYRSAHVR